MARMVERQRGEFQDSPTRKEARSERRSPTPRRHDMQGDFTGLLDPSLYYPSVCTSLVGMYAQKSGVESIAAFQARLTRRSSSVQKSLRDGSGISNERNIMRTKSSIGRRPKRFAELEGGSIGTCCAR